jgi:putative ABC transport system permease protein
METLWQDVRYGLRMLAKNPGFTTIAVLTLALGIGANTAIFSIVSAVLLEPLPYENGERLATAVRKNPGLLRTVASYPDFTDWHESGVFAKSAAVVGKAFFLDSAEGTLPVSGRRVTEEFFDVPAVRMTLGRSFLPDEVQRNESVAVISHQLWATRLGSDPQILGQDLRMRGETFRVVGVLPASFVDPVSLSSPRDVYVPLVASQDERSAAGRNSQWVQVVGRLRDGITLEQAAAQVEAISEHAQKEIAGRDPHSLAPFTLISLREHHVGDSEAALWMLLGAVGFVLLIGSANVSNLLLARITTRRRELAVRAALGAGPRRLAGQLLTESLLLSLAGGGLALLFVLWTIDLIKSISPVNIPRLATAGLDFRVFGFALLTTFVAALLFSLLPMLRGTRQDILAALKQASGTGSVAHARSRSALLAAEVALTIVLLVGASLAFTSLQRLLRVNPGFETENVLTVNLTYAGEWKHASQRSFSDRLLERVRTLPGVRAAGVVDNLPFSGAWSQFTTKMAGFVKDSQPEVKDKTVEYQQGVVGGEYFRVMGIRLKAGRYFDERDAAPGAASVILSESLARTIWGDADPIGREVSDGQTRGARVVGVVGDVRHFGLETQLVQTLYRPLAQREAWGATLVVLGDQSAAALVPAIRGSVRALDSAVVFQRARTMDDILRGRTATPRFLAVLLASFATMSVLLAAVGIYGVFSYTVRQRTPEIGVRIALGAQPGEIFRLVVKQVARVTVLGAALGLAGAVTMGNVLTRHLYDVRPAEPLVLVAVPLLMAVVALAACYVPARRATRVDPMVALRYE